MLEITLNGANVSVDAPADAPLLFVLNNDLDQHGAKFGCGLSQCGAFTVASSIRLAKHAAAAAVIAVACVLWPAAAVSQVEFHHVFDNSLLDVAPKPGEQFTEAVREFHRTGKNPYGGKPEAIEGGKQLYGAFCQGCHMPDGSGGMGANLIGDKHNYPRITTDKGLFEVVFGGAAGAMQPFELRMSQDQILHVMAYVRTLKKK